MTTSVRNFERVYSLLRGKLYFRLAGSKGAWTPFGPTKDASLRLGIEEQKLPSGDDGTTLDIVQTAKTADLDVTLQSLSNSNLAIALQTAVKETAALTDEPFTLPALLEGQTYFLSAKVTEVSLATLVEGEDYSVDKASGCITALKSLVEAEGTYSSEAVVEMGILANSGVELELMYDATEQSKLRLHLFKWKPSPAQNLAMNSGNEHTSLSLTGSLIAVESTPADATLGKFGRLTRV
ncbi:hypothetical protein [Comamonas terrigena]|uniref:phage tail tube protein n=1 Tax=Comamonas terrigena TaxID=32013 RepID=UPI00289D704D|nr:hypothetical protein [Comamonas terrigena]